MSAALGFEHRAELTDATPDAFYHGPDPDPTTDDNGDGDPTNDAIPYGQTVPIIPIEGRFHTNEVFGELDADIISPSKNTTMIHSLDVQAAARYVDHLVAGGDITWTVGSRYAPVRDISFRGNSRTRSAPRPSRKPLTRPARSLVLRRTRAISGTRAVGPSGALRAELPRRGHRSDDVRVAGRQQKLPAVNGRQPEPEEREADAYSIGAVFTPTFVPRLNLSVDYINVKLKDAISNFSASQVLDACYDAPNPGSNPFCDLFTRNPAHQITFVETSFFNAAQLNYRGIVASWDYRLNTPFLGSTSTLGLSGSYQHLIALEMLTPNPGAAEFHNEGTLGYPWRSVHGDRELPQWPALTVHQLQLHGAR